MTIVLCFLDETIEKSMDYGRKFFEGHKFLVYTQISDTIH